MRIAVCDDDSEIIREISEYLEEYFNETGIENEIFCFRDCETLIAEQNTFDMAFIDIELNGANGLTAARAIQEKNENAVIIIVTSYPGYLDEAMEISVYRYLSKPINKERFMTSLAGGIKKYFAITEPVILQIDDETIKLSTADILWLSIEHRCVTLHTPTRKYETKKPMEWWRKNLNSDLFAQPHKSYLVNLRYVTNFTKTCVTVTANGESHSIYCSQRKYIKFKYAFYSYLKATGIHGG